jgi:hypothetical protein
MQGQLPGLVELRFPDGQHPGGRVEIVAIQTQRLTASHAGGEHQADEGLHGRGAQR